MNTEIIKREESFLSQAQGIKVTDQTSLDKANLIARIGKELIKEIKAWFKPLKEQAKKTHDDLCAKERAELGKIEPLVKNADQQVATYLYDLESKRREAAAAAKKAEEEQRRIEEEALLKAQEAEMRAANAKTEAERKVAQAEADKIIERAAAQEKKLDPVPVVPEKSKVVGQTLRDNWVLEIYDAALLPREYLIPDGITLGKMARLLKEKMEAAVPGARAVNRPIMMRL